MAVRAMTTLSLTREVISMKQKWSHRQQKTQIHHWPGRKLNKGLRSLPWHKQSLPHMHHLSGVRFRCTFYLHSLYHRGHLFVHNKGVLVEKHAISTSIIQVF